MDKGVKEPYIAFLKSKEGKYWLKLAVQPSHVVRPPILFQYSKRKHKKK